MFTTAQNARCTPPAADLCPFRILWIDDDRPGIETLARLLTFEGFGVDIATSGVKGLLLATCHSYGLILLDFRLPDASGIDVLCALREVNVMAPVAHVTGFATIGVAVEAIKRNACDVLEKPLLGDEIVELAKRVGVTPTAVAAGAAESVSESPHLCRRLAQLVTSTPNLSLAAAARELGLERHKIERAVREQTGRSFRNWRRQVGMRKAAEILRLSDAPMKAIAADFGYAAQRAFARAFTAVLGVAPCEYRKRVRSATHGPER